MTPTLGNPLIDSPDQRTLDLFRKKMSAIQPLQTALAATHQDEAPLPLQGPTQPAPTLTRPPATGPSPLTQPAPTLTRPPATGPSPLTQPAAPIVHRAELSRLTAPEIQGGPLAHTKADTGRSGIGQIHNPWLRGLATVGDVIGSGFFPRAAAAIPGTQMHHQGLVNMARAAVNSDEAQATAEANRAHLGAETTELGARGEHEGAEANRLNNPTEKQGDPTKTIETENGIMGFNPATGNYDKPIGQAPGKHATQHVVSSDGSVIAIKTDAKTGETTHEVIYHGDPKVKTEIKQIQKGGKAHQVLVNSETGAEIKDLGESGERPPTTDHGVTMIGPDGKVLRLQPGQNAPQGGMTPSGFSSINVPTSQTRTMAETAPKVQDLATRIGQLVDQQAKTLGPAASRWSEFMAGKVGAPNPEFTKLRTDVGLLQTALMRMHVGARGGEQIMEHFRNLIDVAKQSPENLKAAIGEIQEYAKQVAAEVKRGSGAAGGEKDGALPGGVSLQDIDAEIARRKVKK